MKFKLSLSLSMFLTFSAFASEYAIYACREESSFQKVELEMYGHIAEIYGWRFTSTGMTKKINGTSYQLFEGLGSHHFSAYISKREESSGSRSVIVKDGDSSTMKKLECRFERKLR
jgi:hypothetical protein